MATATKGIRVLLAKSDMDAHDMALRYVAQVLRDAGMEVIFIRYQVVDEVAQVALQEAVDVIGLSFYSPGLVPDTSILMKLLKEQDLDDVPVMVGGIIPAEDIPELQEMGVKGIFGPGSPIAEVVDFIISEKGR